MKKVVSLIITLILILSLPMNTLAADQKSKTNAERAQAIKDTYGFTEYGAYASNSMEKKPMNKEAEAKALTNIEAAFALLGKSTTKKIFNYYTTYPGFYELSILIYDVSTEGYSVLGKMNSPNYLNARMMLHTTPTYIVEVHTVVHETLHAFDLGILAIHLEDNQRGYSGDTKGGKAMAKINGSYSGFTNTNQYLNYLAAQNEKEDFAYTAEDMITRGGQKPCTLSKDTKLYKKYVACYELLLDNFGAKSNAVKRAAAFLGKELPEESK